MEEKKKRGRPPGSTKKKEVVGPFNPSKLQEEFDAVFKPENLVAKLPETVIGESEISDIMPEGRRYIAKLVPTSPEEIAKKIQDQKNVMRANGLKFPKDEISYPSNWNELGKVAKLQWLTEHRK